MRKKQLFNQIRKKGWNIDVDNIDLRRKDATLWYGFDSENPILQISKEERTIQLIATGDIRIYGKRNAHFIFKGEKPEGKLTPYLRKHGTWENNNWLEINDNGSSYKTFETSFFNLTDAIRELLSKLKQTQ